MTSRERLLAAYRLQEVDRVPMHIRGVRPWDEAWVSSRDASYGPLIEAVAEHGDYVDSWGAGGGRFYTVSDAYTAEAYQEDRDDWVANYTIHHTPGGDMRTMHLSSKRGLPGMQMEFMVKSLEDLDKVLSVPYVPARPDCSGFFEKTEKMGERGIVWCALPNAISMVHNIMGSELMAIWSVTERPRILELIRVFHERCLNLLHYLLEQGCGPIFAMSGEEYVTPPMHSPRDFREFVVEPEQELAAAIHAAGKLLHIHCHGPISGVLEDFMALGADCLHPIEPPPMGDVTIDEAKRRIGHRICIEGNIQIGDLYAGDTAELVAQVRHNLDVTGGRGYIVCPTASPHTAVLTDLTVRNYLAMIEAVAG